MKCFNCERIGHFSNKCPYPKQEESYHEESCCHKDKTMGNKMKFYSKEYSDDGSEYAEILFIGTTNLDEESEVDIESQYMVVVDEIEKRRKRNRVLKEKMSNYQEETNQIIVELKNQLQEAKNTEEDLVVILKDEMQDFEKLEK